MKEANHVKATALRDSLWTAAVLLACFQLGANPRSHKYAGACGNARFESNV